MKGDVFRSKILALPVATKKSIKNNIKFMGSMLGFMWRSDVRAEYVEVPTHVKS